MSSPSVRFRVIARLRDPWTQRVHEPGAILDLTEDQARVLRGTRFVEELRDRIATPTAEAVQRTAPRPVESVSVKEPETAVETTASAPETKPERHKHGKRRHRR